MKLIDEAEKVNSDIPKQLLGAPEGGGFGKIEFEATNIVLADPI